MSELTDTLSQFVEKELVVNGVTLKFNKFTLAIQVKLESKGLNNEDLMKLMSTQPTTYLTEVAYMLLDNSNKQTFPTLDSFREALILSDLEKLSNVVYARIGESYIKEEELKNG